MSSGDPSEGDGETSTATLEHSPGSPDEPATSRRSGGRPKRFRYTLPGAWVSLVFLVLAFTPSLLPRGGLLQGVICGVSAAIGYGFGVVGAWVWRAFADREPRAASSRSWRVFFIVAGLALLASLVVSWYWQDQVRALMDLDSNAPFTPILVVVVATVVFVGLVALGRVLRRLYLALARLLTGWIGQRAARVVGWVLVVVATYLVVSGLLLGTAADLANQMFSVNNGITQEGVVQPTSPTRSGSAESAISWDSLGREGRTFVAGGPSQDEIAAFTGEPAMEPIRVFAGLESADTTEERAQLAVQDLERAGGFERANLMVATSTGSGWISPGSADTYEYMTDGDSAIVSMQYSYLPSWISYLVDQAKAREAGRDLFDAVYERWLELPEDTRPKLVVFGESLGSFGAEAAFSGERDMATRTSGALLTGPPNFNTLYREFTDNRDEDTPEVQPTYHDGRIVRIDSTKNGVVEPADSPWDETRVLYVQHPSDPIVWWSPNLLLYKPDWMGEPRGSDVLDSMQWIPFVTFWQVSADLPNATSAPGHGHVYTEEYVEAWAAILEPEDWTPEKQQQLEEIING